MNAYYGAINHGFGADTLLIKGQVVKVKMKLDEENIKKFSRLFGLFFKFLCGEHLVYVRVRNLS